jgi:uncharacterized protein (DUF2236 family)
VPATGRDIDDYIETVRPDLRADARTRTVAEALLAPRSSHLGASLFRSVTNRAAIDLLPPWAARMHGLPMPDPERLLVRGSAHGTAIVMRWALRDGSARRARRRVGAG